jgi:hypothetical protein
MRRRLGLAVSCCFALACVNVLDDVETPSEKPVVILPDGAQTASRTRRAPPDPSLRLGLAAPLRADSRYYWTVRLRDGDRASTWSTYAYFDFFLIGLSADSNELFTFSTP